MSIEDIKVLLFKYYDIENENDYNYERGCYVGGYWLSIEKIIEILERGE